MQTLWSRFAQKSAAGSACKCPQCLTFASGLTKRAGATAARRTPKYVTSSTLWYSGIFAAAATLDAGVKVKRREKWDEAIAEVKKELGQEELIGEEKVVTEALEDRETVLWSPDILEEAFGEVEPTFRRPRWPANTGGPLQTYNLAPESIYADGQRRAMGETRAWTPKKIEMISLSVDLLQLRIMIALINRGLNEEAALSVPHEYGANLLLSRDALHAHKTTLKVDLARVRMSPITLEGYERTSPHEPLNNFGAGHSNEDGFQSPRELNLTLQDLMKRHKREEISLSTLLANICYNLSITNLPPNLDTYNTLLLGLSTANVPNVVTNVIHSLQCCNLRPNETSITAILNHYTATGNAERFVEFVQTMRGKHNGLSLARPDIRITAACNGRLVPKEGDPTKIIQLPYPTPKVFAALIAGVLKFGGFDTALGVCKNMGEEGWGLCMSGLSPLLQDCADQGDWESGLSVWDQVRILEERSKRLSSNRNLVPEKIPMQVYAAMLRLCLNKGDRAFYDQVWAQATEAHQRGAWKISKMVKSQIALSNRGKVTKDYDEPTDVVYDALGPADSELDNAEDDRGTARIYREGQVLREIRARRNDAHRPPTESQHDELSIGQLDGSLPANKELEEYEFSERPMYLRG